MLSSSRTCLAAAYSDPRGDLGTCMQTQNTARLFNVLNQMHLSATKRRNKAERVHRAATHLPLEDVPPMVRVLHKAVLRWLYLSSNSKCTLPGLFAQNAKE